MSDSGGINQRIGDLIAAVASSGATPPVISHSVGVNAQTATPAGVVRNGKGDFTVNFPLNQCDPLSRHDKAFPGGLAATAIVDLAANTDASAHILLFDFAGVAIDTDFSFESTRIKV
jgi:hypothetical protein